MILRFIEEGLGPFLCFFTAHSTRFASSQMQYPSLNSSFYGSFYLPYFTLDYGAAY